jgi:dCTP deaminase
MNSILSYEELVYYVVRGKVLKNPDDTEIPFEHVNSTSIDIRLGSMLMVERRPQTIDPVNIDRREQLNMQFIPITERDGYSLHPGEFVLAQSFEIFNLPTYISAEYKLKSSMARNGLEHLNAGWCDAGWNGSVLTLELKNMTRYHALQLRAGMLIGQMVFYQHTPVPEQHSYAARGRYNGDRTVQLAKP